MDKLAIVSLKIFFWILIGGLLKLLFYKLNFTWVKKIIKIFSELIVWFIVPYFVGTKIWITGIKVDVFVTILCLYLLIMITTYLFSRVIVNKTGFTFQEVYFPLTFMNTLYLGVPVTEYFISLSAVDYTIIYSLIVTIIQFTAGLYILKPELKTISLILKSPVIYIFLCGWLLNINKIPVMSAIVSVHNVISYFLSPVMLIFIGYSFPWKDFFDNIRLHVLINLLKIMVLFLLSLVFVLILKQIKPVDKDFVTVLVLISILPSAIINYILLERINIDTKFVCGEIFWGTFITLFILPYIKEALDIIFLILF